MLSLVLEKDGYPASIQPLVTNRLTEIQHSVDRSHHPGGGFGGLSHGDIPEDASDEISRALEGSLFDELEDSLLSGGTHRKRVATLDAKATQSNIEDRKGYQQMAFIASLASNWRCVLADLDTPGVYEALERIVSGESSVEVIAEARAKDSPIEAHLFRMAHVVDEDAIGLASTFIDQIDKASLEDEHLAKQLRTQAIRRAFVLRAIEVFSFYHTLKDDSENSRINFPLDMPFQVLDYDHGMPLFESPDNTPLDDSPTENIATREKQFQRALREKLGALLRPVQEQPSAPVPVKDDMSAEEWNKIARKYYTPPKSKLAHMQEEWINNIQTKEGTSWERMQDLKDEDSMKFLQRKRLVFWFLLH